MKKFIVISVLTISIIALSISCDKASSDDGPVLRLATWNLEWFGALGRTPEDISRIAGIIKDQNLHLIALQEITCECTLKSLAEELNYEYFISTQRVPQKLALLWNPKEVQEVEFDNDAYNALVKVAEHGLGRPSRQPLVFNIKSGEFDFRLVVVHLKSVPEADYSVEVRNIQYDSINAWLKQALEGDAAEKDIIIAGDFNSFNHGISSERLRQAGLVEFTSTEYQEQEYSNIWYNRDARRSKSLIDHIAITPSLRQEEYSEILPIKDLDVELGEKYYENSISDHLPVIAVFKNDKDID